jgi:hypothetical protein
MTSGSRKTRSQLPQSRANPSPQTRVRVGCVAQSGKAPALTGFAAERASARFVN